MTALRGPAYYGGKSSFAGGTGIGAWVASMLPPPGSPQTYCEPFAGMLGVLLARERAKCEIANDLDGNIINWWRVVRDRPGELADLLEFTPWSRTEYAAAREALASPEADPVRRALAFHVVLVQGRMNATSPSQWRWKRRKRPKATTSWHRQSGMIHDLADRLRRVELECKDAVELIRDLAPVEEAVIYCDPPYRSADTSLYAHADFSVDAMTEAVSACRGRVAISGYGDEWDHLGWERHEFRTSLSAVHIDGRQADRTEVLWTSFTPEPALSMFRGVE